MSLDDLNTFGGRSQISKMFLKISQEIPRRREFELGARTVLSACTGGLVLAQDLIETTPCSHPQSFSGRLFAQR